jgi:hypothetical protein
MEFLFRGRQIFAADQFLMWFHPWHMSVIEDSDPIGRDVDNGLDRLLKGGERLMRQSIDHIYVYAIEPEFAAPFYSVASNLFRLDPVYSFLNLRVEILDTYANPVETALAKRL